MVRTNLACLVVVVGMGMGAGAALPSGCGSGPKTSAPCEGRERCSCYPNGTCNTRLVCLSDLCVSDGSGGSGGGGTGGTVVGSGGTVGPGTVGANAGTGGANAGTGGTNAGTGGRNAGTGGASSSGGQTGSGGSGVMGTNLLKNGDFSAGKEYWELTWQAGEVAGETYSGGEYCIYNLSAAAYLSFSLGNPPTPSDAFVIEPGVTYTLSYRAKGSSLPSVTAKIGHATIPYTEVYSVVDGVSTVYQIFSHQVTSSAGDTGAGLVFNGTLYYSSNVCFDDVKFVKN